MTNQNLNQIEAVLNAELDMVKKAREGISFVQSAQENHLNLRNVHTMFRVALQSDYNTSSLELQNPADFLLTPVERLYSDIFGYTKQRWLEENPILPADAEKSLRQVMQELSGQEQQLLSLYYFEEKSYTDCAKEMKMTTAQAHSRTVKAIRKLRHPKRARILKLGLSEIKRIKKEREALFIGAKTGTFAEDSIQLLKNSIDSLYLPKRAEHALKRNGYFTVKDILSTDWAELQKFHGIGDAALSQIQRHITLYFQTYGLSSVDVQKLRDILQKSDKNPRN